VKQRPWFVYMLECAGGRIYTGVSPDVAARFEKHRAGAGGAFTRSFPPRRILAAQRCAGRGEALSAEHALKQLERPDKLAWARRNPFVMPAKARPRKAARGTRR
jgi:putative endonuclease